MSRKAGKRLVDRRMVDTIDQAAHYMTSEEQETINGIRNAYDMTVIKITARAMKRKQLHEQVRHLSDDELMDIIGEDYETLEAMPGDDLLLMMDEK